MKGETAEIQREAEAAYGKIPEKPIAEPDEPNWKRIATEFRHVPGTMGDFYFHLCETIVRADLANTAKLRAAYPELVHWIQDEDL